jgi:hypothetical protein
MIRDVLGVLAAFVAWYLVWALADSLAFVVFGRPADRDIPGLGASGAIAKHLGASRPGPPRCCRNWGRRSDLNRGPADYETDAAPNADSP